LDPVEVRRRNLLHPAQLPHRTPTMTIDSGDYVAAFDDVLALSGYDDLRREQRERATDGSPTRLGVGVAIELTPEGFDGAGGLARGHETATVRLDTSGRAV